MEEKDKEIKVEDFLGLVKSIASKYASYGLPFEDLVQEGLLGLLEAKGHFDKSKEAAFSTYAYFWIKKRILEALTRENHISSKTVDLNEEILADIPDIQTERASEGIKSLSIPAGFPIQEEKVLRLSFEERKTYHEIAEILGISRERVRQLINKAMRRIKLTRN